ncbi:MAG: cyclase family protein, partial [Flavobacteriales bacterium]|nr:cyclase family protein [Flavobacteriales bacterium]
FVIIYTGWEQYWGTPEKYRNNYVFPSISKEAASLLLDRQIVGLGIDTLSPDRPEDGFPVHHLILGADKYIIENIANASKLPSVGAHTFALSIKIQGGTEAPLRLVGMFRKES